jgi:hypothetical protein
MIPDKQYTYMWQPQPYKTWKGDISSNLFNVINTINKRPIVNAVHTHGGAGTKQRGAIGAHQLATSEPAVTVGRNSRVANAKNRKPQDRITGQMPSGVGAIARNFGPQPLKHWRLQLNVTDGSGNVGGKYNKLSVAQLMDRPGTAHIKNKPNNRPNSAPCKGCNDDKNGQWSQNYFDRERLWGKDGVPFSFPEDTINPSENSVNPGRPACVACNPENNVIKSAVTLLNKNYYTDSRAYLRSRCKTFTQNENITQLVNPNARLIPGTSNPAWPEDNTCGPQTFYIGTCPDRCQPTAVDCCGNNIGNPPNNPPRATAIFKPNNVQFQVQGAVDSSSRIARLKYNTITKYAASFTTAFGAQAANAGKYTTNSQGPYFIKNKLSNCTNNQFHRQGNSNVCAPIPRRLGYEKMPGGFSGCRGTYGASVANCS